MDLHDYGVLSPLALHSARRVDKSPYPRQETKSN